MASTRLSGCWHWAHTEVSSGISTTSCSSIIHLMTFSGALSQNCQQSACCCCTCILAKDCAPCLLCIIFKQIPGLGNSVTICFSGKQFQKFYCFEHGFCLALFIDTQTHTTSSLFLEKCRKRESHKYLWDRKVQVFHIIHYLSSSSPNISLQV